MLNFYLSHQEELHDLFSQFNIQWKNPASFNHSYWKPLCTEIQPPASESIKRAHTESCKREMNYVACLAQDGDLFPDSIPK